MEHDSSKPSVHQDTFVENNVLQALQEIYSSYLKDGHKVLSKEQVLQLFFEYNIIDAVGYNIFSIQSFLDQLTNQNEITLKNFYLLIFYIYRRQIGELTQQSEVSEMSVETVNEIVDNSGHIFSQDDNVIKVMVNQHSNNQKFFALVAPMFQNEEIIEILASENINVLSLYQNSIRDKVFSPYVTFLMEKGFYYINIAQLNNMIHDLPLFVNFSSDIIMLFLKMFIKNIPPEAEDHFKMIIEQKCSEDDIKENLNKIYITSKDINFSYSSIVILLGLFAIALPATQSLPFEDQVKFFFEEELKLESDANKNEEKMDMNEDNETEEEFLQESATLAQAKLREQSKEDSDFMRDFLFQMDKALPPEDDKIIAFANDSNDNSNNLFCNQMNIVPAKFPADPLLIEKVEEEERRIEFKENIMIDKAKKASKKEKPKENPFQVYMEPLPSEKNYDLKYFGKPSIETLTNRLIKSSYKDILPNTNVYPSLIQEVLMIPKGIQSKSMELVVDCFQDQIDGHLEKAICRLEKAKESMPISSTYDAQTEIFYDLCFGSLYESLNFDLVALKYYYDAKLSSDKLLIVDPDYALVYCFLGEIFVKMKEFKWAMRCFLKAKKSREDSIGGDTPDTATVYNNLGVVCYHLQSYLPANGYLKLAYEIYKSILGINHPRTMLIKSNLRKMSQLNFNKVVQFKSLGLYPTPAQIITNPKKKKK